MEQLAKWGILSFIKKDETSCHSLPPLPPNKWATQQFWVAQALRDEAPDKMKSGGERGKLATDNQNFYPGYEDKSRPLNAN